MKISIQIKHYALYILFGVLTTFISLTTYKLMLDIGINYIISSIVSFIISVMFAFVTNRRYVFKANLSFFKDMIKFYFARVFTLIFNIVALILAVQVFKFDEFISQIFLTVIIITVNYILSKWIIFK